MNHPLYNLSQSIYQPENGPILYRPWLSERFSAIYAHAEARSLVSRDRCYVLERMLLQTEPLNGEVVECGVYRGGTAAMLAYRLQSLGSNRSLHLFDSFLGLPACDAEKDWHKEGDFNDTSLEMAQRTVQHHRGKVRWHVGWIPDTFRGLEAELEKVSFVHIDVDIYSAIIDCLTWLWPRLMPSGVIVFDDYGFPTCPGARLAVDDFFSSRSAVPLVLQTGQAMVMKSLYGN